MDQFDSDSWIILNQAESEIKRKIEVVGTPLKNWDIKINYGIKTGFNDVFIINSNLKEQLVKESKDSSVLIKPLIRGKDVSRYHSVFQNYYIITTFPALNINITKHSAIHNYLLGFKNKLVQEGKQLSQSEKVLMRKHSNHYGLDIRFKDKEKSRKRTSNDWFETQDQIGYHDDYNKEKIFWKRIGSIIRFSYSSSLIYGLDSTVFLVGSHIKFLLALLNSKLLIRELLINSPKTGTGDVIISVQALEPLLVADPVDSVKKKFEDIVDVILEKKEQDQDTSSEEQQIDLMVYKLYELTYDEVLIVDPETPFTKAEYEDFKL